MADLALSDDLRQTVARGRRDLAWLLAPVDALEARALAAEAAARGAAFREGEAANEAAVLRARLATADALAAQRDELIATMMDAHEGHKRAAVYADRLLAEARAQVEALTAEAARSAEAMRRQAAAVRTLDASRSWRADHEDRTLRSLAGVARAALLAELDEARRERDDWNARATALESERDALTARVDVAEAAARGAPARPLTPGVSECLSGPCHDPDDSCHDSGDAR